MNKIARRKQAGLEPTEQIKSIAALILSKYLRMISFSFETVFTGLVRA